MVTSTGVTVMVATCTFALVFCVTNDPIVPVPLAARPMDVLLFVQLNTVPGYCAGKGNRRGRFAAAPGLVGYRRHGGQRVNRDGEGLRRAGQLTPLLV